MTGTLGTALGGEQPGQEAAVSSEQDSPKACVSSCSFSSRSSTRVSQ